LKGGGRRKKKRKDKTGGKRKKIEKEKMTGIEPTTFQKSQKNKSRNAWAQVAN
jgi:hypothetical protein